MFDIFEIEEFGLFILVFDIIVFYEGKSASSLYKVMILH